MFDILFLFSVCKHFFYQIFNTIKWNLLWHIVEEIGVPTHLITLIINIYANNLAYICNESELSGSFQVEQSVRQSRILSPLLFYIYGEWIMKKATDNWNGEVSIGGNKIFNLRYADDTVPLANTEIKMASFLEKVEI